MSETQQCHAELVSASTKRFRSIFGLSLIFILFSLLIMLFAGVMASCTTEVTLTLKGDDSLDIRFEAGSGETFTKLLTSGDFVIDSDAVSYELAKAGFENVKVNQKKSGQVSISMSDKKQSSYIFTSKILNAKEGKLSAAITRKSLEDFYDSADEQTRMILDLFLAPVFNNEQMTESEYLEMVGAFYGESTASEIKSSTVIINLISKDGSKETMRIPLSQLFCGNF